MVKFKKNNRRTRKRGGARQRGGKDDPPSRKVHLATGGVFDENDPLEKKQTEAGENLRQAYQEQRDQLQLRADVDKFKKTLAEEKEGILAHEVIDRENYEREQEGTNQFENETEKQIFLQKLILGLEEENKKRGEANQAKLVNRSDLEKFIKKNRNIWNNEIMDKKSGAADPADRGNPKPRRASIGGTRVSAVGGKRRKTRRRRRNQKKKAKNTHRKKPKKSRRKRHNTRKRIRH